MPIRRSASGIFLFSLAIENRQSKFETSYGGIAQLVERQLCKLEVRGSNPLASSLRSRRRGEQRLSRRSLGVGGHLFALLHFSRELRLGKPVMTKFFYVYILQSEADPQRFYTGLADDLRTRLKNHNSGRICSHRKMETVAIENLRFTSRSDPGGSARTISEIRFSSCIRKATFLIRDLRLVGVFSICDLRLSI